MPKISELTELTGASVEDDDLVPIVDTSATTTKKIQAAQLAPGLLARLAGTKDATSVLRGDFTWGAVPLADPLSPVAASGATETIDVASHGVVDLTLTDNCTLTMTGAASGSAWTVTLVIRQDGTGGRTITWPSGTDWAAGSPPTLTSTANAVDVISLMTVDGGTTWLGFVAGKAFA